MAALAESSLDPSPARQWLVRGLVVLGAIALLVGLALGIRSLLVSPSPAHHQTARIAILPDTPPPPPPPPKDEKKPEPPKDAPQRAQQPQPLKQDTPKPAEAPIKMDGPAGDGPSAFAAGAIRNDYQGGAPVVGAAGGGGDPASRAQERLYANSVRQLLHDAIEKHLRPDGGEAVATFSVWIAADGTISRLELVPTGDGGHDADLRAAFDQTRADLRLPAAPAGLPQPLRFRLTVRPV